MTAACRSITVPTARRWPRWLRAAAVAVAVALAQPAAAIECGGRNLFDTLAPARIAALDAAVAGVPFAQGIRWRATRGDARIDIVGTYHFADPRHARTVAALAPAIAAADALLVEAGPKEEARLSAALADDPALIVDATGPTLPERLGPQDWAALSTALSDRGIPAILASKMRPWYVSMMLGLSPCMLRQVKAAGDTGGLDHLLIDAAQDAGVPVRALEPWDTLFGVFAGMTDRQEDDMIRAALPAARHADDYAATTTEAYFAGDIWRIWEFGRIDAYDGSGLDRATVDEQMRLAQDQLMDKRNRRWIEPLTLAADAAAGRGKGIVAAFGALHLPGEQGVLRLLEKDGWTIERTAP
ncbi:TraB/GumN family protein [Paracoccus luteus]|uniref:TraB/GumN family protein n=1 Tax=Paracoccus luteus TaxID=2508543 RepID=UPI00106F9F37|nr:TraB/GumN family protein [Paracoccus luteus]